MKKFGIAYSSRIRVFPEDEFLFVQSTYLYAFLLEVTIPYSFNISKPFSCYGLVYDFLIIQ